MPAPHPRMHGLSHEHGGPDPIQIAYESVGTGGGGTGGGPLSWCRVRKWNGLDQSIPSAANTVMQFNDVANSDTAMFTGFAQEGATGSANNGITVLQDGLYRLTARMYWDTQPTQGMICLNAVDSDAWAPYCSLGAFMDWTYAGYVSLTARLAAGRHIYVTLYHTAGVPKNLYGYGGNYFEAQRLGESTVTDIAGGPP